MVVQTAAIQFNPHTRVVQTNTFLMV